MPSESHFVYWDACVFTSYLNKVPDRIGVITALLEEIENSKQDKIVTSIISRVEVAYTAEEKVNRALNDDEEARINALWADSSVIELAEINEEVCNLARNIMRHAITRGWSLKPIDAIHLATAQWVQSREINTYDMDDLKKYEEIMKIPIRQPMTMTPRLITEI